MGAEISRGASLLGAYCSEAFLATKAVLGISNSSLISASAKLKQPPRAIQQKDEEAAAPSVDTLFSLPLLDKI